VQGFEQVLQLGVAGDVQLRDRQGVEQEPFQLRARLADRRLRLLLEVGRIEEHQRSVETKHHQAGLGLRTGMAGDRMQTRQALDGAEDLDPRP
jgi:hypothetical protein